MKQYIGTLNKTWLAILMATVLFACFLAFTHHFTHLGAFFTGRKAIHIVQKWSDEHPVETMIEHLKTQHPKVQLDEDKTPRLLQPRKRHGTHRPLPLRFDELPSFQRNIRTADTAFQTERNQIENRPLVKRERNTGV